MLFVNGFTQPTDSFYDIQKEKIGFLPRGSANMTDVVARIPRPRMMIASEATLQDSVTPSNKS